MVKTRSRKKKRGEEKQEIVSVISTAESHSERDNAVVSDDKPRQLPEAVIEGELKGTGKQKSVIKRIFIASFLVVVLFLVLFFVSTKIKFIFNDELNMRISPLQQSFSVGNRDTVVANITLFNSNFIQCRSQCKFTLTNLADESIIYTSNETVKHNEKLTKQFTIKMPGKGSGQLLYMFESECINLRSIVCLTNEDSHYKSSMVTINYDLAAEEARAKEIMQQSLNGFRKLFSEVATLHEENLILSKNLPPGALESQALRYSIEIDQQALDGFTMRSQELARLWSEENYTALIKSFSGEELSALLSLKNEIFQRQKVMIALIEVRNDNLLLLQKVGNYTHYAQEMMIRYQNEISPENNLLLGQLDRIAEEIFKSYIFVSTDAAHSEEEVGKSLENSIQNLSLLSQDIDRKKTEEAFLLIYYNNLLRQKGINISLSVGSGCAGLRNITSNLMLANENSSLRRASDYNWSIGNESFDRALKIASINMALNALNKSREQTIMQVLGDSYNRTIIIIMIDAEEARLNADLAAAQTAPSESTSDYSAGIVDGIDFLSLALINISRNNEYINRNCAAANYSSTEPTAGITKFLSIPLNNILGLKISSEVLLINISLPELSLNPSLCCVFKQCTPCCSEPGCRGAISPVIFIHGHAFNDANTPENSMSSFTKIQRKMMSDGFVSFGELDLKANQENSSFGEWGESRAPVTVRASYYYITYYTLGDYSVSAQKAESVENYALRLKEIIDLVKYKTGSEKVSLVAHSMGGLVAREYATLFGYGDLSKIILVNTPNHGVSGKVKEFCSVLGAKKECGEMAEGSIFLSKLNARKMPAEADIYSIRSTGCEMDDNKDGDGIVTSESAYLEGAKNYEIKGNCTGSLKTSLHSEVLDPTEYPETYGLILSILSS